MQDPAEHVKPMAQSAGTKQVMGQELLEPSQTYGAQVGLPAAPAGSGPQAPSFPGRSQALQGPPQSLLQQ